MTEAVRTVVHLVRHGEVHNPEGVLYGRLPDYHLSDVGRQMAVRIGDYLGADDVTHMRVSPMERAQETAAPLAAILEVTPVIDDRVIEAGNRLEGRQVRLGSLIRDPRNLWLFRNPLRPSWGESYPDIVDRMRAAMDDAAAAAAGHEAVIVSHQLPIWASRSAVEGRRLWHDPRKRQCSLASVTSFTYVDGRITQVVYAEPAKDLLRAKVKNFVQGA